MFTRSEILDRTMRDSVLRIVDRSTIGRSRMLVSGPFCLFGFCRGMRMPSPRSNGCPSSIAWLKMSASGAQTMSAEYFQSSPATSSGPLARLLLSRWRASLTSRSVMGYESGPLGMSSLAV